MRELKAFGRWALNTLCFKHGLDEAMVIWLLLVVGVIWPIAIVVMVVAGT